jgi:hypothetical protein
MMVGEMKRILIVLTMLLSVQVHAQIETPEECILNTLKSGTVPKELASMVRSNCVQKYIKQEESSNQLKLADVAQIKNSTLTYLPPQLTITPSIASNPRFQLTIKNDSPLTVITVLIIVKNLASGKEELYRLTADYPIQPYGTGVLLGQVSPIAKPEEFWKEHIWGFNGVFGVTTDQGFNQFYKKPQSP